MSGIQTNSEEDQGLEVGTTEIGDKNGAHHMIPIPILIILTLQDHLHLKRVFLLILRQLLESKYQKPESVESKDDRSQRPIRERIPLPDLDAMKRMMSNLHRSNQIAEKREKDACKRKLEVIISYFHY